MQNHSRIAPVVLRLGLVFVFVWFGLNQILFPARWESYIPDWVVSTTGQSAQTFVYMNALFELVCAVLLALGSRIRIVATLLAIHMLTIVVEIGFTAQGVRDIGLMFALISVALHGPDTYSFDKEDVSYK